MGKGRTGGQFAAPIVGNFLKVALADKKPVPFRQPPGIKTVRVNLKTGIKAAGDDKETLWEFFKPFEEPDDAYSVIGVTSDGGSAFTPQEPGQPQGQLQTGRRIY